VTRTWDLHAHRYDGGRLMHVGPLGFVKAHLLKDPIVAVRAEELEDLGSPEATHYGWEYLDGSRLADGTPHMIQIRAGDKNPTGLLDMCFAYGMKAAIEHGEGRPIALRVAENRDYVVALESS
jgi:hypothetical protein